MTNNLAIYVSSYDGCSDIWDVFFDIWERFWDNCCFPVYLVTNQKHYSRKNVIVIKTGKERNWFFRTITSLEQIDEKYVLFMLEDYFLSKRVDNEDFDELVHHMENNGLYYCRLSDSLVRDKKQKVISVPASTRYAVSLQPGIWDREHLLNILKMINKESPWDFEYYLENNLKADGKYFKGICYDTRDILGYKNGVLRGKWIPKTINYYSKIGYDIQLGSREVLAQGKLIKYEVALFGRKYIPKAFHTIIKKILAVLGFKYV